MLTLWMIGRTARNGALRFVPHRMRQRYRMSNHAPNIESRLSLAFPSRTDVWAITNYVLNDLLNNNKIT